MKPLIAPLVALSLMAGQASADENKGVRVTRVGSQPSVQGAAEYFRGRARVDGLFQTDAPARVGGGTVTFEPGARTAWRTHPLGQMLIVTAGVGYVQQKGQPRQEIRPGDTVWIAPNVRQATTGMTHIALAEALDGSTVTWAEQVSDHQYAGGVQ